MDTIWRKARGVLQSAEARLAMTVLGAVIALLGITLFPVSASVMLAFPALTTRRALKDILAEAKRIQEEYRGKEMPQEIGEKFDALCEEADSYQKESDREERLAKMEQAEKAQRRSRTAVDPALPGGGSTGDESDEEKTRQEKLRELKNRVAGYVRVGDFVAMAPLFKKFLENGMPRSEIKMELPNILRVKGWAQDGVVPVGRDMRKAIEDVMLESKSLPVFGSRVIEPDRLTDMVIDDVNDRLRLRDVLNVSPTTSNLIEWIAKTSYTRAAAIVSDGAAKPEAAAEFELRSTGVKTIAVWMPVTEQQLQDAPALVNLIQQDLIWDLGKEEEEQMMWETGAGQNFNGIINQISAGRTVSGDTLIDQIRRAITDIRIDGYEPNAVALHPIDWASIQLVKGSDGHYIWIVVTDATTGVSRVWGLQVVETVACLNPAATDRKVVVGDWARGATLYDRMQSAIAIGYKDDDFIRNLRTIRAENRIAFAVRRTKAFRYIDTL